MKIYTLPNTIVLNDSNRLIPDGNLPIYPYKYTIFSNQGTILISTIGILPTDNNPNRVGTFQIGGTCRSGLLSITLYDHYPIYFEGPVYGTLTLNDEVYSSLDTIGYTQLNKNTLTLNIQIPGSITEEIIEFYVDILINDGPSPKSNDMLAWPIFQYLGLPNQYVSLTPSNTNSIRFACPFIAEFAQNGQSNTLLKLESIATNIHYQTLFFSQMIEPSNYKNLLTQNISVISTKNINTCQYIQGYTNGVVAPLPSCTSPTWASSQISIELSATATILMSYNITNKVLFVIDDDINDISSSILYQWLVTNSSKFDVVVSFSLIPTLFNVVGEKQKNIFVNTLTNQSIPFFIANGNYSTTPMCGVIYNPSYISVSITTLDPPIQFDNQPDPKSNNPYQQKTEYIGLNANSKREKLYVIPKYQIGICYDININNIDKYYLTIQTLNILDINISNTIYGYNNIFYNSSYSKSNFISNNNKYYDTNENTKKSNIIDNKNIININLENKSKTKNNNEIININNFRKFLIKSFLK
jgi:hypothetical protein